MRHFDTGAMRDTNDDKINYAGHLSPEAVHRYCEFLHRKRRLPDGSRRDADNWKKGMPPQAYLESLLRHMFEVWRMMEANTSATDEYRDAICAVLFNANGLLYESLQEEGT